MATVMDDYNEVIGKLNESQHRLSVYVLDWAILPAGVRTAIKNAVMATIDQSVIDLAAVKARIQAL
jgi:hypothetical protein